MILILQETLEAALLVSILAALSLHLERRLTWLAIGLVTGLALALAYSANLQRVSEAFDYAGQEVLNAVLQGLVAVFVIVLSWCVARLGPEPDNGALARLFSRCAAAAVALSVCREGSEILIYLDGFLAQPSRAQAVLLGTLVGVGIGVSVGLLLFYGLWGLSRRFSLALTLVLLALFAGNMLSQASVELIQADLIGGAGTVWNSGSWLPEQSLAGHLLYALVGYEATPSFSQAMCYAIGVLVALLAAWLGRKGGDAHAPV